jgi:NAD(P)-dependent dehydrogenase (short-subunit alcohol dehydrogenase family)
MMCRDKVALVTGAAGKGMGRSIALTLAREGAKVAVNYRTSGDSADEIVAHVCSAGGKACAIQADVQTADGCQELVEKTLEAFGQIDICVVGPGGGWHMEPVEKLDARAALQDASEELAPVYHLMPLVLPAMYERKWGRVVALSLGSSYDSPAYAYNVAKAARSYALLCARDEAWNYGVTMNIIGPGPVPEIPTLEEAVEHSRQGAAWQNRNEVSPQDIAETAAFLCSEAGRFITGCIVPFK